MNQHIFEYLPHSKTVCNREYLFKCEECINLNFSSRLEESKGVSVDETDKEVTITGNAEAEVDNNCELDNDDNDTTWLYEFTDVPSYVSVITFSLSEPMYIMKIFEKGQASEVMSDRCWHKILVWEFYFRGNHPKACVCYFLSDSYFSPSDSPSETMKNVFYFI